MPFGANDPIVTPDTSGSKTFGSNDPTVEQAAAAWRARTGAAADVPTPYDGPTGAPQPSQPRSLSDILTNASSAAGDTATASLMNIGNAAKLAAAGVPTLLGDRDAADALFDQVKPGSEEAAKLQQQGHDISPAGATIGSVLGILPTLAAGELTLPARASTAGVPLLTRILANLGHGAPVAAALGTQQAAAQAADIANQGGSAATTEKAYLTGLGANTAANLLPIGAPGGIVLRSASGAALGAAGATGSQELQHLVTPQYVPAPTQADTNRAGLMGAMLSAITGGRGSEPLAPWIADYRATQPEGPLALPAPESSVTPQESISPAAAPTAPADAEAAAVAPAAAAQEPSAPLPAQAEAIFKADPRTALSSLDYSTLTQVARDSGFHVEPGEGRASIVGKIVSQPTDYLHSDVLPEYLAAVAPAPVAAPNDPIVSAAPGSTSPSSLMDAMEMQASPVLAEGNQIAVDSAGTAYTPKQGAGSLLDAMMQRPGNAPGLPSPVTAVDSNGVAIDSQAFTRSVQAAQAAKAAEMQAASDKASLGITPDIKKTQAPRWQQAEQQRADIQATLDAREAQNGDLASQRDDDSPAEPPWWLAGQHASDEHDAELANMAQQRESMPPEAREEAESKLSDIGIAPADHEEALAASQLLDRAYDAGATTEQVNEAISEPTNGETAQALRDLATKQAPDHGTEQSAIHEIEPAGAETPNPGRAGAGAGGDAAEATGEPAGAGNAAVPREGRSSGGITKLGEPESNGDVPIARKEAPIVRYRREAAEIEKKLPSVEDGYTRLWRGNRPGEVGSSTRFTNDLPGIALPFKEGYSGDLSYVDVPTQDISKYEQTGTAAKGAEFIVPKEIASSAKVAQTTERSKSVALHEPDGSTSSQQPIAVPTQDRRDDWSPETEGRAVTAIDALVQKYGGSTLADSIRDDFRATTTAKLVGQVVKSPEDLAALASVYRNPAFETARYMFVDKGGTILGETAVSSRMPSTTAAFPTGTPKGGELAWLISQAPEGSTGMWMVHNHPSGNPKPSTADLEATGTLGILLGDKAGAPKLQGHVVLDHETFGNISPSGEFRGIGKVPGKAGTTDPSRSGRGDLSMFDVPVTAPAFAAVTGKKIAAATPEDSSAIVVMNAQGSVVSVHTFPNDFLATPRGAAMVSRLGAARGAVGLGIVMSRANYIQHRATFEKAITRNLLRDATIVSPDGTALNIGNTGLMPNEYRAKFGVQSKGAMQRSESGVQLHEQNAQPLISLSAVRRALADRGVPSEQIAAMSAQELRAEQQSMRARSAPTPDTTGIKNATVAEERAMKGQAEVEHDLSRSDEQVWNQAKAKLATDAHAGTDLALSIIKKPRPISDVEAAVLTQDRMRIANDRRAAFEGAAKAQDSGDESTAIAYRERVARLDALMEANDQAAKLSGHETGAALRARRLMSNQDYSMAALVNKGKVAAGRTLESAEKEALEARALDIEQREAELAKREAALRDAKREPREPAQRKTAKARFDDLAAQLQKIAQKDHLKPGCVV